MTMLNNLPAPAGYVLVTDGVVQEGDWVSHQLLGTQGLRQIKKPSFYIGYPVDHFSVVVRPPQPEASDVVPIGDLETAAKDFARMWRETQERERELREALAWAVKRIERFAPHRASEGDGELYALANAKALAKAGEEVKG